MLRVKNSEYAGSVGVMPRVIPCVKISEEGHEEVVLGTRWWEIRRGFEMCLIKSVGCTFGMVPGGVLPVLFHMGLGWL